MSKKSFSKIILLIATLCNIFTASIALAESITVNIIAQNATNERKEKMEVRQDLPKEIKKDDVIDLGGLSLGYDEERAIYYVYTQVDLEASGQKDYKIIVKDVWRIPSEELEFLKGQADLRLKALEGKESYNAAKFFRDKVFTTVEAIETLQETQKTDIESRINSFRVNSERVADIRQAVSLIDNFAKESERYADYEKEKRTIKMTLESENPDTTSKLEQVEITRYLPEGIRPDYVIDPQGFDLRFDPEKNLFYLTRKVDFEPGEKKKFELSIADLWYIPVSKLENLEKIAEDLGLKLVGSDYDKLASYMINEIKRAVSDIKESQSLAKTPEDKISVYAINSKKLEAILKKISDLRGMIEELEKAKAKKITEVIKSVTPDVATTWKLIYATIAFLSIISFFFYILWWGQTKAKQGQKVQNIDTDNPPK